MMRLMNYYAKLPRNLLLLYQAVLDHVVGRDFSPKQTFTKQDVPRFLVMKIAESEAEELAGIGLGEQTPNIRYHSCTLILTNRLKGVLGFQDLQDSDRDKKIL